MTVGKRKREDRAVLKCKLCPMIYSARDVEKGKFFPSTGICRRCYKKMQRGSATCFGKRYTADAQECQFECPDREICRVFCLRRKENEERERG